MLYALYVKHTLWMGLIMYISVISLLVCWLLALLKVQWDYCLLLEAFTLWKSLGYFLHFFLVVPSSILSEEHWW
jgi:hypothetical protein